ncbi:MAG: ABC transporter permease [Bryobacteraceae bacterium]|jgi:predicted permease
MQEIRQDLVYGARMLAKSPAFTAVAILSLALGIGANTAIFSLIDTLLLRQLPVVNPHELVALTDPTESGTSIGYSTGERGGLSTREFEWLRDQTRVFAGMFAAQSQFERNNASLDGKPQEEVWTRLVSGGYFTVLGTTAFGGRVFTPADEHGPGSAPYAVISYAFWQRRFNGSTAALGSAMRIGKADLTIIGIAQPHFLGEAVGTVPDVWIPLDMQPLVMPGRMWLQDDPGHTAEKVMWLHVIGRLKPGVTRRGAQANVDVVFKQIVSEEFSKISRTNPGVLKQNLKLHDAGNGVSHLRGNFANPLYVLMGFVGLVLVIACANVANLLLARATSRQKEMGVRLALGARRARIVRQFLTESLMLSIGGGIVGALFAIAGVRLLIRLVSDPGDTMMLDVRPDLRVLLFTIGVCLATGIVFGFAPAWRSAGINVAGTLKEAGRGLTASTGRMGAGKLLVVGQIALSAMLLIGAGWFLRTLSNLESVNLGYPRERLVLVGVDLLSAGYSGERLPVVYNELRDRLARIPGVRAVTYSQNGLFSGSESGDVISVEGYTPGKQADKQARFDQVGPDYFRIVGIPVVLGREIGPRDVESAESVCVVNESFAKFYFGGASPLGKHVTDEFPDTRKTFTIVGVARDARDHSLRRAIDRRFYLSALQRLGEFTPFLNYEVRTSGDPSRVVDAARRAILGFDPTIPIGGIKTMDALIDDTVRQERLIAQLSTVFGALALLLAGIGLYGVLSYAVAQRTGEIGIRMALGAQRGAVARLVLRETGILIAVGLAIGVPASLAAARLVRSTLFGLQPADPVTLACALGVMVLVAAVAGYLPAHRASRVDPLIALRYE